MKYILSKSCRPILEMLARQQTLCAFDFDGTLSPIVEQPDRAGMRARTENLLRRLASLYPCIVVSGRARADVLHKLNGVPMASVIGNHGAETEDSEGSRLQIDKWIAALKAGLESLQGVWVEDKGFSLAVHYRQSRQKVRARRKILAAVESLENARVLGGKQVVNLALSHSPNKGDALVAERDRLGCTWALYAGDDDNDEDAFAVSGASVSVRVGRKMHSHARYYLRTQSEIDSLLECLVQLREPDRLPNAGKA